MLHTILILAALAFLVGPLKTDSIKFTAEERVSFQILETTETRRFLRLNYEKLSNKLFSPSRNTRVT